MAKLDLDWLAVFVEVYKMQSVSRAAQRLGLEQASASIALGKLRRHFDDPLFTRTSAGMEPTPRAQALYPDLAEALARIEKARGSREAFSPHQAQRAFRLCMTDISEIVLLPRLINHLQKSTPGLVVEAEKISPDSRRRLESGEVDLAVGFTPDLEAGFYQQALFAQDFVCLASKDHPRVRAKLSLRAFTAEGHIVVSTFGTGHSIVDKVLARHKIERRVVLRVPSFLGVARIVAQTEFLVIVPRLLGKALVSQERVQLLEPPVPLPSYKVKQHWHERFNADAGSMWLRKTMVELFSNFDALGSDQRAGR
jgi:DNA-binding transcriptional LysR family regulator